MFGNNYMIPPQGVDRRGPTMTGGGKEKSHWIYSAKHHAILTNPNWVIKHSLIPT